VLPDYGFKPSGAEEGEAEAEAGVWPAVSAATSLSGFVGVLMTVALVCFTGVVLKGSLARKAKEGRSEA